MAINVEVERNTTENNSSVLRRFSRRVQAAGILPRVRSIRYKQRNASPYAKKRQALKQLNRKAEVTELIKLGKMQERIRK